MMVTQVPQPILDAVFVYERVQRCKGYLCSNAIVYFESHSRTVMATASAFIVGALSSHYYYVHGARQMTHACWVHVEHCILPTATECGWHGG